jgi:hypothetical protein
MMVLGSVSESPVVSNFFRHDGRTSLLEAFRLLQFLQA